MDKIIFFDIDKTLFDREKFLNNFFNLLETKYGLITEEIDHVGSIYREVKDEYGYFTSEAFLVKIYENFPLLNGKLNFYFMPDNLVNFMFDDSKVLFDIKNVRLGIFSKGDSVFQKAKIVNFKDIIKEDLIYIFHNKLEKLPEILNKHIDSRNYFVDDNIAVLLRAKELNLSVTTIFIDRSNDYPGVAGVDFKISSLFDIIPILSEHI